MTKKIIIILACAIFFLNVFIISLSADARKGHHGTPKPTPAKTKIHNKSEEPYSELQLQYKCLDTNTYSSNPKFGVAISNEGNLGFDLARVELRYWFNDDGTGGVQSAECTYVSLTYVANTDFIVSVIKNEKCEQNKFISATFVKPGFILEPGQEIEVHFSYYNSQGSQYNQSNDYSFNADLSDAGDNQKINLVYNGTVLYGYQPVHIEPQNNNSPWVGRQILVRFNDNVQDTEIIKFERQYNLTRVGEAGGYNGRLYPYYLESTSDVKGKVRQVQSDSRIKYAQPNYIYLPMATSWKDYTPYGNPNDPAYQKSANVAPGIQLRRTVDQWGLRAVCADSLSSSDGWNALGHGNTQINIGVLDTGVAFQECWRQNLPQYFKPLCADLDICNEDGLVRCNTKVLGHKFTPVNNDVPGYIGCNSNSNFNSYRWGLNKADDDVGHGTHVTGIIGAVGNNNSLMAGMMWNYNKINVSKITPPPVDFKPLFRRDFRHKNCTDCEWSPTMPILTSDGTKINGLCSPCSPDVLTVGHSTTNIMINEIMMQIKKYNADVINISFGTGVIEEDYALQEAIDYAYYYGRNGKGTLIIVAAGNSGAQVIQNPGPPKTGYFPAACERVLVVSASDENDHLTGFSNWGPRIDIAAPGKDIWSTYPMTISISRCFGDGDVISTIRVAGPMQPMSGTSMAAPFVTGAAALILSKQPDLTVEQLIEVLKKSAYQAPNPGPAPFYDAGVPYPNNQYFGAGRLSLCNILTYIPTPAGLMPTFTVTGTRTNSPTRTITLTRTQTRTVTPTRTDTYTRTITKTYTPSRTQTETRTKTSTPIVSATYTLTCTLVMTKTETVTQTPTITETFMYTEIETVTETNGVINTITLTATIIVTPTNTYTNCTQWTQITASAGFSGRSMHSGVEYDNKMWIIAGMSSGFIFLNDVWYSSDGILWTQATAAAEFSGRRQHTSVVFNDEIWVIGGTIDSVNGLNDVWRSSDGINWLCATTAAPFSTRMGHTCLVYDNKIWVIAGSHDSYTGLKDVWYSSNGIDWYMATGNAAFKPKTAHMSVVYNNYMWVMGGNNYLSGSYNDVWYSSNGSEWLEATDSAGFSKNIFHTSVVFDDEIWVIGGTVSDTWSSNDGINWKQFYPCGSAFGERVRHSSVVYNNAMWVIAGSPYLNDVWRSGNGISGTISASKISGEKTYITKTVVVEDINPKYTYNYPNPAKDSTTIRFPLQVQQEVLITIYDLQGKMVWKKQLGVTDTFTGINTIVWNAKNEMNEEVANGVYLFKIVLKDTIITKKIAIIR